MTDYRAQHDADALLRTLETRIDQKIAAALKVPTGITPGTAYGSVIFDAQGRATWGGAGGSSGAAICYWHGSGQAISDSTPTVVDYDFDQYDSADPTGHITYPGGLWTFTAVLAGWYEVHASVDFAASTAWAVGELADLNVVWTGGSQLLERRRDMPSSASATGRLSGAYLIDLDAGDTAQIQVTQASGGTRNLTAGGGNVILRWIAAL